MRKVAEILEGASNYRGNARASILKQAAIAMIAENPGASLDAMLANADDWQPVEWNGRD